MIIRYAGRNRIEDGLGISVNFFHLDCLASEVRLNVDLDAALTVIANGCYRWLAIAAQRLREGRPEATLPPVRRDRRDRDDPARPPDRRLRPPQPQPDPARGRPRPRLAPDPVARPTDDRVHLPLTTTVVRGLIIFPAVEIGVQVPGDSSADQSMPPLPRLPLALIRKAMSTACSGVVSVRSPPPCSKVSVRSTEPVAGSTHSAR